MVWGRPIVYDSRELGSKPGFLVLLLRYDAVAPWSRQIDARREPMGSANSDQTNCLSK